MNVPATRDGMEYLIDVFVRGDFAKFTPAEEAEYIRRACSELGLKAITRPIEFINMQGGRRVPYVKRDGTDQLRKIHGVSVVDQTETERDGVFIVTVKVTDNQGRTDMAKGAVSLVGLRGDALANALMKAETKAKRRATLSICGLGWIDETEIDELRERDTRPKLVPQITKREIQRQEDWNKKFQEFKDYLRQETNEQALKTWKESKRGEVAGFPPHMKKELNERYDMQLSLIRSAALADQVVHDSDDMEPRPATPEDFDPATGEIKDDPLDLIRA